MQHKDPSVTRGKLNRREAWPAPSFVRATAVTWTWLFLHSWLAGNEIAHSITLHYNWWLSFFCLFVFFSKCAKWNRSNRFGKVPSGGSGQQGSAPAWDAEMQWGQSKAMISGLWNCDLSLLPVCRIDLTGWHSAFWTGSCFMGVLGYLCDD